MCNLVYAKNVFSTLTPPFPPHPTIPPPSLTSLPAHTPPPTTFPSCSTTYPLINPPPCLHSSPYHQTLPSPSPWQHSSHSNHLITLTSPIHIPHCSPPYFECLPHPYTSSSSSSTKCHCLLHPCTTSSPIRYPHPSSIPSAKI